MTKKCDDTNDDDDDGDDHRHHQKVSRKESYAFHSPKTRSKKLKSRKTTGSTLLGAAVMSAHDHVLLRVAKTGQSQSQPQSQSQSQFAIVLI